MTDMMRITFYCKDQKTGEVLRLLAGIAIGTPEVQPVSNASVVNGHLKADTEGNAMDMFVAWLKKTKKTELIASDVKEYCRDVGKAESSYGYLVSKAKRQGLIKKMGHKFGTVNVKWKVVL